MLDIEAGFKVYVGEVRLAPMKIGEVAALAGVPTATVRYYERRSLIPVATRAASGYRQYAPEAARRLRFIKHARGLGFSLDEIQEMLDLRAGDPSACGRVEAVAREKVRAVRQQLADLQRLERTLQDVVASCKRHGQAEACPVLAALDEPVTAPTAAATAAPSRRTARGRRPRAAGH